MSADTLAQHIEKGEYAAGGNVWAAAHVNIGEQRVIELALAKAKEIFRIRWCSRTRIV